jgi:hypothetical protein
MTPTQAQAKLDAWRLTRDWLNYTARPIFGNIVGAPEPSGYREMFNTVLAAIDFEGEIADALNTKTPLLEFFA